LEGDQTIRTESQTTTWLPLWANDISEAIYGPKFSTSPQANLALAKQAVSNKYQHNEDRGMKPNSAAC